MPTGTLARYRRTPCRLAPWPVRLALLGLGTLHDLAARTGLRVIEGEALQWVRRYHPDRYHLRAGGGEIGTVPVRIYLCDDRCWASRTVYGVPRAVYVPGLRRWLDHPLAAASMALSCEVSGGGGPYDALGRLQDDSQSGSATYSDPPAKVRELLT